MEAMEYLNGILGFYHDSDNIWIHHIRPPHRQRPHSDSVLSPYSILLLLLILLILHEINSTHVLSVLARILFEIVDRLNLMPNAKMPKYQNVNI